MTEHKKASSFGNKYMFINALCMIPGLILLGIMFFLELSKTMLGVCMAIFAIYGIVGLYWQRYRESHFKCPDCGSLIVDRHQDTEDHDPIDFYCEKCDVEWETGLRDPGEPV